MITSDDDVRLAVAKSATYRQSVSDQQKPKQHEINNELKIIYTSHPNSLN